ncbi:hypothetical protein [Paenibacillus hemerocallicola]|jgi:hypothetical protein|uniref:hypothetical protein n=1 Tax=Paenibacillus hemerocallicola TaxID=1172614 RepID=UPI00159EBD1D|nr:hypothetical protein [Paenibacillus hemerocallicola]
MAPKEKLFRLFDQLNEKDQKKAFEFMQSLAHRNGAGRKREEVSKLYGKDYFVVSD